MDVLMPFIYQKACFTRAFYFNRQLPGEERSIEFSPFEEEQAVHAPWKRLVQAKIDRGKLKIHAFRLG